MIRGFYTAASGLVTQEQKLNTYANNVSNATTPGFKKDNLVLGTFGEHIAVRMDQYQRNDSSEIGRGVFMQTVDSKYTDYAQGSFDMTNRTLDAAIQGEGFFVIQDGTGNQLLTRDGQFALDDEGFLILPGFGRVQGEGGDIELGNYAFVISSDGTISLQPDPYEDDDDELQEVDRLLIVIPTDYADMDKASSGLFEVGGYTQINDEDNDDEDRPRTAVLHGALEKSNVDMSEEMTRIISSQRGLQSASQLVKMFDEMNQKSTETLGRVR